MGYVWPIEHKEKVSRRNYFAEARRPNKTARLASAQLLYPCQGLGFELSHCLLNNETLKNLVFIVMSSMRQVERNEVSYGREPLCS